MATELPPASVRKVRSIVVSPTAEAGVLTREMILLLAETFVTVVVAFPLFLVIIIAIFAVIGGGGSFMIDLLWGIVGAMIPLAQFGFIFFMYSLAQEMV